MSLDNRIIAASMKHDPEAMREYDRKQSTATGILREHLYAALGLAEQAHVLLRKWRAHQEHRARQRKVYVERYAATLLATHNPNGDRTGPLAKQAVALAGSILDAMPHEYTPPTYEEFLKGRPDPFALHARHF